MFYNVRDLRDAFVGPDLLVQLPATYVSSIEKIIVNAVWNADKNDWDGDELTDYDIGMGTGLLRIYDVGARDRRSKIFVRFTAGLPADLIPLVKEIASAAVSRALTNTYGVNSEAAGGVSISYNANWSGKGSSAITNDTREALDAYKVKGVY